MSKTKRKRTTVGDAVATFETIAPCSLAQDWDNVGLLTGHPDSSCRRILCCIDMTQPVVDEAVAAKADLILAYHPPLFRPIKSLRGDSTGTDALVWKTVSAGIAIYSMHTALDAADGGTNDVLAELSGLVDLQPFTFVADQTAETKLVTFVPAQQVDAVAAALANAGAGRIGNYSHCSFRIPGHGTFFGDESTDPVVGQKGQLERVDEIRLEMVVPTASLPNVTTALVAAHPYEEPAYDLYSLAPKPARRGIGRTGRFPSRTTLAALARKLKKALARPAVQIVGDPASTLTRGAVCVGTAGMLPLESPRSADCDCIITGEIRHHDALTFLRCGKTALALGHWTSERPVLDPLAKRIKRFLPGVTVTISQTDADPLQSL
jgi:dinuclear metal center YbgI/SA1388 family protein